MFTKTFTIERHIEEMRAELRVMTDAEERREIQAEVAAMLRRAGDIDRDGVHFSILSGINFVKSLVDQSVELAKVASPDPSVRYLFPFLDSYIING